MIDHQPVDPLVALETWPVRACAGWATASSSRTFGRDTDILPWASVTKVLTALAVWVGVEEGTVDWDDPAGPPGSTVAHLLAHASGLSPDGDRIVAPPGQRRIYSNAGIEAAADHLARRAGMSFVDYVTAGVIEPLAMTTTTIQGSPASGGYGPLTDLLALARELLHPTLIDRRTLERVSTVAFPGLAGVLPGFGRQEPNDWGLGVEVKGLKHPHWTGRLNSPETFGHFGQSGSFLWVDPRRGLALASLATRPFGPWAIDVWPALSDSVVSSRPWESATP